MVRSLWTAASGMIAQQNNVDTIANNLANVNTTGYKTEVAEFKSLLYQDIQANTTSANGANKPVSAQVGLGVRNSSVTSRFTQGNFYASTNDLAFAINGDGFFGIQGADGNTYYTRNGDFHLATYPDGLALTTSDGNLVLDTEGKGIVLDSSIVASQLSISADGELCYPDENNNLQPMGIKIGLWQFNNPSGLEKIGDSSYAESAASGAVCGAWWMPGYIQPGLHMCGDGSPGGYRVMEFDGKAFEWYYKATGRPEDYQFRTYDRNELCLSASAYVPRATAENRAAFLESVGNYALPSSENIVYLNIWDYDPSWKIEVTENGRKLQWTRFTAKEPLYLATYEAEEYNYGYTLSYPGGTTSHLFEVRASAPDTALEIKVTDRFGRVYTETMARPKKFSFNNYR